MRSTWISGFYRFSTRKAGSLDIFRFRISRSDDFGIGPFLESNPPPYDSEAIRQLAQEQLVRVPGLAKGRAVLQFPASNPGNVDPGITEIKTSFKFKRRDSKG